MDNITIGNGQVQTDSIELLGLGDSLRVLGTLQGEDPAVLTQGLNNGIRVRRNGVINKEFSMQATLTKPQTVQQPLEKGFPRLQMPQRPPRELVFISGDLQSLQLLTQGVLPGKDGIVLHPAMDGMMQIARYMAAIAQPVRSLHIVVHGAPGELRLGGSVLSLDSLEQYSLALRMVKAHLTPDASISLHACSLASNLQGQQLVQMLHYQTGAEIGASTTAIGDAGQGGNWELDYATSGFQAKPVFKEATISTYPHILETPATASDILDMTPPPDLGATGMEIANVPTVDEMESDPPTVPTSVTVSIENLSPENGTFLTPLWFGFHDGTFDTYDRGRPVSPGLESLAEDGATDLISQEFDLAGFGTVQGTILGEEDTPGPIDPGETASFTVELDPNDSTSQFFSYASMIIPSNDFFIANGNEQAHPIFDAEGNFIGADFIVLGTNVLDAGSEENDEIPANTAFFGQMAPDTGTPEDGVVQLAEGFIPDGPILSSEDFSNADFTAEGFQAARIRVFAEDAPMPAEEPVDLNALVTSTQEVPNFTGSSATGISSLALNETGDALSYNLTLTGLDFGDLLGTGPTTVPEGDDVSRIHIHAGGRGENGPVALGIFDLVAPEAGGQDADDLTITENPDGSVTLSGIWEETDDTSLPLGQFIEEIRSAEAGEDLDLYWNIHTEQFPGGEIRGQLQEGAAPEATPVRLTVSVENLGPQGGAVITPFWFGLHDGSFNTFDPAAPAAPGLEIVAEDGFIGLEGFTPDFPSLEGTGFEGVDLVNIPLVPLSIASEFASSSAGERGLQGIITPADNPLGLFPGESGSQSLTVFDPSSSRFLSYASMIFPSNDAFIGDIDPLELFDAEGNFIGANFLILGEEVWDAGTEVNDESLANIPFSAEQVGQGMPENGTVQLHEGLLPPGNGGIVDLLDGAFAFSDFTTPGYQVAQVQVFAEHLVALEAAGGQNIFTVPLNNAFAINQFGGVGQGAVPSADLVDEIDTIQFQREGLTAESLLLTQEGDDLRLSFEDIDGTSVLLTDFALEDLDNLPGGAGNILFDGGSEIVDSFDVFDADATRGRVFNRNTVTFLNDMGNAVRGFNNSADVINGQGGNDLIRGLSDDDLLRGGEGDDTLIGGIGSDSLVGGDGADTFAFGGDLLNNPAEDLDTITDFATEDNLDFSEFLAAGGELSVVFLPEDITVNLSSGDSVVIQGELDNLNAAFNQLQPIATEAAIF